MKVSILQQDMLPALQMVARSCGVRSGLPVLANVLLQTDEGKLKLSATNLEIGVIKKANALIEEEGQVTVPARTLLEIISSLSGENLELEASNEQLKIATKNFHATINGISATEFPVIPLGSDKTIQLQADLLGKSLPEVSFSAAIEEGRPVLTGILTEIKDNKLELVATDGFRLAHRTMVLEGEEVPIFSSLIPRRTFEEVVRIIAEELSSEASKEKIEISISENQNQIIFKVGQALISSRLIEGQFPSWEKIIPTEFVSRVIMEKNQLLKALKLATVFSRAEAGNLVKIILKKNIVTLSSESKELGTQETNIECNVEGEEMTVAFNAKFIQDVLQNSPSSQLSFEFSGNLSPCLIKPVGEAGLEYVIMPVRLA